MIEPTEQKKKLYRHDCVKLMLEEMQDQDMTALELTFILEVSDSSARHYLKKAIDGGAIFKSLQGSRNSGKQSTYSLVSKEAAAAYLATIPQEIVPIHKPTQHQKRIEAAAREGRRFICRKDPGENFVIPDREPVFRHWLDTAFFGEPKATS